MSLKEKQHYVPQLLLRNFQYTNTGNKGRMKLYYFNKKSRIVSSGKARDLAQEKFFYSDNSELEDWFSEEIEAKTAPIISNIIIDANQINLLTIEQELQLKLFFCMQLLRTDKMRDILTDIVDEIQTDVRNGTNRTIRMDKAIDFKEIILTSGINIDPFDTNNRQKFGNIMLRQVKHLLPIFIKRDLFLLHSRKSDLYISDNPVTTYNNRLKQPYALGENDSLIFMPLSPRLCLCAAFPFMFKEKLRVFKGSKRFTLSQNQSTHLNELQFIFSKTYIYSKSRDFRLAFEMTKRFPSSTNGIKFSVTFD